MQGASAGSRRHRDERRRRHDTGRRQTSAAAARNGEGARMAAVSGRKKREELGKAKTPPSGPGTGEGGRAESRRRGARAVGNREAVTGQTCTRDRAEVTRAIGGDSLLHRGPIIRLNGATSTTSQSKYFSYRLCVTSKPAQARKMRDGEPDTVARLVVSMCVCVSQRRGGGLNRPRLPMTRA